MKAEPTLKVVIDTNIWISAALSPSGAPAQVIQFVLLNGIAVFSKETFAELETRIWKPKFDRHISIDARRAILRDIKAAAHWVSISEELQAQTYCRDADDDKFIHTALAAHAPWLVTGDADLLDVPQIANLTICTPASFAGLHV